MGRGGFRPGAGRKPKPINVIRRGLRAIEKASAADILAKIDEFKAWQDKLESSDERISLQALMYLTDKRDGKAPSTLNLNDNRTTDRIKRAEEILAGTNSQPLPAIQDRTERVN